MQQANKLYNATVSKVVAVRRLGVVGGIATLAANSSFADSILSADTVTAIAGAKTDMTTIITAVLGLCVASLAFRWVKATFFG